ncbi:hypothetical protein Cgig2_020365 [Carnegiea gigantea]|uniref:Uncharacterized protein n=1 Tax=Carnegiea gigantea TaxID=171969 RepID=A0A9Q1QGL7_9CARY|nr:hypothetical protein Cgig2_020365 [Carnegiea gigantea]
MGLHKRDLFRARTDQPNSGNVTRTENELQKREEGGARERYERFVEEPDMEVDRKQNSGFKAVLRHIRHVPGIVGYGVMQVTNSRNEQLEAQLRKTSRPETRMMGQVNKERLAEYLGELQRKENTNDRYVAALRGETLTRNPYVRIQPIPKQNTSEPSKE